MGTIGEVTKEKTDNGGKILNAMLAVDGTSGKYPEFKGNVATVYTHDMARGGGGDERAAKKQVSRPRKPGPSPTQMK